MRQQLAGISAILALVCADSQAEELTEFDFLNDESIVVSSATRLSQELQDVPASVTIIDRQMIEASSAINLIELMRLVPGFQVGSIDGTESTATYHGLSSQHNKRLQILVNGRSVYQSTFGGALWYTLPVSIDEIEKIEVLRGPNAASFGANAFSAVVNIITFRADSQPGLKIGHLGGERDTKRNYFSYASTVDRTSFRINAEIESNTGYQSTYKDFVDNGTAFPLYDDHNHRQLNFRFDRNSGSGESHILEFGFKTVKFGAGYFDTLNNGTYEAVSPNDKRVSSHYFNYTWEQQASFLLNNRLQLSHQYVDQNESWLGSADGFFEVYTWGTSFRDYRYDIEFQQNRIFSPKVQSVWGVGARYDVSESIDWLALNKHDRFSLRAFGHIEYKQNDWLTWNAGGFLENHENIGNYFSPRLALNLKPTNKHSFRANISQAYRMPSFTAEYADQTMIITKNVLIFSPGDPYDWLLAGNTSIEPEMMTSYELGFRGLFLKDKLDLDLRIARESIEDIIDAPKTATGGDYPGSLTIPRFRYLNYGAVDIDSVELQIKYKPTNTTFFNFHASYTNADGFKPNIATNATGDNTGCASPDTADVCSEEELDNSAPLLTTGFLVSHQFDNGVNLSSQYTYHDAYRTGGDGDVLSKPLESIDIKISKEWKINNNKIKASAIVRNITDEPYEDFENDNLVGREAYFQLEAALF